MDAEAVVHDQHVVVGREHHHLVLGVEEAVGNLRGAGRLHRRIVVGLEDEARAGDLCEALGVGGHYRLELADAGDGEVVVVGLRVLRPDRLEVLQPLDPWQHSGELVRLVQQRHEGGAAARQVGGGADRDDPRHRLLGGEEIGEAAPHGVAHRRDRVTALPQVEEAEACRVEPLFPPSAGEIVGRGGVAGEARSTDRKTGVGECLGKRCHLYRRGGEAMDQQDPKLAVAGAVERGAVLAAGLELVDAVVARLVEGGLGVAVEAGVVPAQRLGDPALALHGGEPDDRIHRLEALLHRRRLVDRELDVVFQADLVEVVLVDELGRKEKLVSLHMDQVLLLRSGYATGHPFQRAEGDLQVVLDLPQVRVEEDAPRALKPLQRQIGRLAQLADRQSLAVMFGKVAVDDVGGDVAQVDGGEPVHLPHVAAHEGVGDFAGSAPLEGIEPAKRLGDRRAPPRLLAQEAIDAAQQPPVVAAEIVGDVDRFAEAHVHVGGAKEQVALDAQLLQQPPVAYLAELLRHRLQDVVGDPQGEEGDVRRYDTHRPGKACLQGLRVLLRPVGEEVVLERGVAVGEGALQILETVLRLQGGDRRASVGWPPRLLAAGVDLQAAVRIEDLLVLDHAPLGEDHHLAADEDLVAHEVDNSRHVRRDRADGAQEGAEGVRSEKLRGGERPPDHPRVAVEDVLRDEGLEAREVVEEEDVAGFRLAGEVVHPQVHRGDLQQQVHQPSHPLVGAQVDVEVDLRLGVGRRGREGRLGGGGGVGHKSFQRSTLSSRSWGWGSPLAQPAQQTAEAALVLVGLRLDCLQGLLRVALVWVPAERLAVARRRLLLHVAIPVEVAEGDVGARVAGGKVGRPFERLLRLPLAAAELDVGGGEVEVVVGLVRLALDQVGQEPYRPLVVVGGDRRLGVDEDRIRIAGGGPGGGVVLFDFGRPLLRIGEGLIGGGHCLGDPVGHRDELVRKAEAADHVGVQPLAQAVVGALDLRERVVAVDAQKGEWVHRADSPLQAPQLHHDRMRLLRQGRRLGLGLVGGWGGGRRDLVRARRGGGRLGIRFRCCALCRSISRGRRRLVGGDQAEIGEEKEALVDRVGGEGGEAGDLRQRPPRLHQAEDGGGLLVEGKVGGQGPRCYRRAEGGVVVEGVVPAQGRHLHREDGGGDRLGDRDTRVGRLHRLIGDWQEADRVVRIGEEGGEGVADLLGEGGEYHLFSYLAVVDRPLAGPLAGLLDGGERLRELLLGEVAAFT